MVDNLAYCKSILSGCLECQSDFRLSFVVLILNLETSRFCNIFFSIGLFSFLQGFFLASGT